MKPMHSRTGSLDFLEKDWIFEPKLDGIRAVCHYDRQKIKLVSRNGLELTQKYPEFDFPDAIRAKSCILDGEIVVYGKGGVPDFQSALKRVQTSREKAHSLMKTLPANYIVFDILKKNGMSLISQTLEKRKHALKETIAETSNIQLIYHTRKGEKLWAASLSKGIEGVMAKDPESKYSPGARTPSWRKIKHVQTIDCVILGYTTQKRSVSSLALGLYGDSELLFIGKVGTGFSVDSILELDEKLERGKNKAVMPAGIKPVKPELVCEVSYMKVTPDMKLRAPVFIRLRNDKKPSECTLEQLNSK